MKYILGQDEGFDIIPQNSEIYDDSDPCNVVTEFEYLLDFSNDVAEKFTGTWPNGQLKNTQSPILFVSTIKAKSGSAITYSNQDMNYCLVRDDIQDTIKLVHVTEDTTVKPTRYDGQEIVGGVSSNCIYYVMSEKSFYYYDDFLNSLIQADIRPKKRIETVSADSGETSYTINPFVYSVLNPSTATVDIVLSSKTDNTVDYEYEIEVNGTDITTNNVTAINFPSTLIWEGNNVPDIDDFLTLGYNAWVIEIKHGKYASYKRYWNE